MIEEVKEKCPWKPDCGAFRIREMRREKDFLKKHCNINDDEVWIMWFMWLICPHFTTRPKTKKGKD